MTELVYTVLLFVFLGLVLCFMRVSEWHSQESRYWYNIDAIVKLDPSYDEKFKEVLAYAQQNKPGFIKKALGWQTPEYRMRRDMERNGER